MASYDATNDIYGPEGPDLSVFNGGSGRGGTPVPVGSRLRVAGGGPQPATYGSRTITLDPTQTNEEDPGAEDRVHGVLELSGEPSEGRRVQWDDDVVDNEHMNKKKSKICCIFKKQKEFGESSDESSSESDSSGSESDGGPAPSGSGKGKGKGRREDHSCDHSDPNHQHHHYRRGADKPKKRVLNEYERMPKGAIQPSFDNLTITCHQIVESYAQPLPSVLYDDTTPARIVDGNLCIVLCHYVNGVNVTQSLRQGDITSSMTGCMTIQTQFPNVPRHQRRLLIEHSLEMAAYRDVAKRMRGSHSPKSQPDLTRAYPPRKDQEQDDGVDRLLTFEDFAFEDADDIDD
ncbi:Type 1 phosphatases regulator ypi1 [Mortierella antarctica]|nr:Type 1 phosphatases regulator ypi1 [Mortierella antarctica]